MNISVLRVALLTALVAGAVVAPIATQHKAQGRWRLQDEILLRQNARLAELAAENLRLSNLVSNLDNQPLSDEQLTELLRLRGQLGPLRRAAVEAQQLRAKLGRPIPTN